jgi:hypothetical protein
MVGISKIRGIIAFVACLMTWSCVRSGGSAPGELTPTASITLHNQGRDRIQVYLVGEKEDWYIGRLEPLETAHLVLPQFGFASAARAVSLAVVPGWSRSLEPRREPRATFSFDEITDNLPGQEWTFVNGQLEGPMRARAR